MNKPLTRADLLEKYEEILQRGLSPGQWEHFRKSGDFGPGVVVQSSSGSTRGQLLRIPRRPEDIAEIFQRTLVPYLQVFQKPPRRIAMLGGISHTEAALKMDLGGIRFESFSLSDLPALERYSPDVLSCYPNIARELCGISNLRLPDLLAFKLGGEKIFPIDLEKLNTRFGAVAIFEQVGSTEMPALAIGLREPGQARKLPLQKNRFDYLPGPVDSWRPLVARDKFPRLLFPMGNFYDTGDLALYDENFLYDIRRAASEDYAYLGLQEALLAEGALNVQIHRGSRLIAFDAPGGIALPEAMEWDGISYRVQKSALKRLPGSNKMNLLAD
jgi:hypothetical protein